MVPGLLLCSGFSVGMGIIKVIKMADSQQATRPTDQNSTRLAYLVSKFPTITEAWIVREIDAVEGHGLPISLYTIRQEYPTGTHDRAKAWISRLLIAPYRSAQTWRANLATLLQQPLVYL